MTLLRKATNQTAYLKAGIMGFAGSGKTFTAADLAIGLSKTVSDGKPVAFFDTETGSDFLIPKFKEHGIELLVAKTRSFKDLLTFMKEAEGQCSVAVIDSITHVWQEILAAYTEKLRRRNGLLFQDWGPIKTEWRGFTDSYINSKMHVILCGRAGFEYDMEKDEAGKKELIKTGTKMKAESEMGYEPSLLLEMERVSADEEYAKGKRGGWIHRCYILKDRTDRMNGEAIDNPTFASFKPVVDFLNIGGEHVGVDATSSSTDLFESPESYHARKKRVEIVLELIVDTMTEAQIGGTSAKAKEEQVKHLKNAFGTSSWTAIKDMKLEALEAGMLALRKALLLEPLGMDELSDDERVAKMRESVESDADVLPFAAVR
jgi:hypothetical protein